MAWLRQGIQTHKLIINDAKAWCTTSRNGLPGEPRRLPAHAQEHSQIAALAKPENLRDGRVAEAF